MHDLPFISHDMSGNHDDDEEEVDVVGSGDEEFSDESDDEELIHRTPRPSRYDVAFIFELLWRNRNAPDSPQIWLPETIVFRHSHPTGWYFTNTSDGRIMKRNNGQEHFISQKKILEVFDGASGEVTAVFVNTHDLDGKRVAGNIQYFDRQHLREFLYTEDPNRNGFLQKFISLKQQQYHNASMNTLHVNWTRGVLRSTNAEHRTNILRSTRKEADKSSPVSYAYARADLRSSVQIPQMSSMLLKLQGCCERIAEHVLRVTEGRVRINHMIAYFKVGQKGTTWFNFCTSVDVDEVARDQVNSLHAHPKYKGARLSATIGSPNVSLARQHSNGTDTTHHNGDRATPRAAQPSVAAVNDAEGHATDDGRAAERAASGCCLCGGSGAENVCTYSTLMRAMCNWQRRLEKLSKELHRPYPVGSSTLFPPGHQDNSMAATLWHQMKLGEDDRVSLPQVRTMLLFVGLEEPSVDALEVSIAEADNHLTGFINKRLFRRAVANLWGNGGAPADVLAICEPSLPEGAHPLEATGDVGTVLLPSIQVALQLAIPRNDYQRILPPANADRENIQWVKKSVQACIKCCHSLDMLANDPEMHYWDDQLEQLFHKVSSISAHGAHTPSYAYTHTAPKPGESSSPRLPQCATRPPPLTRLEREWIRKRKTGELPGMSRSSNRSGSISSRDGLPSLAQSLPANRPEYRWSAASSGRGGGRSSTLETPRGGTYGGAAALSNAELLAELQRRNLLPGEGGDAGVLGPPLAVVGADGTMAGSRVLPTPPKTPRPSTGGRVVGGDATGGRLATPRGNIARGALGEVEMLKQGISALCQTTDPRWEQLEGLVATFQERIGHLKGPGQEESQ